MTKSFYNTISARGQMLLSFHSGAMTQELSVLNVFIEAQKALAWHEVKEVLTDMNDCSLKRSITNLKTKGILIKTSDMVQGIAGKPVHKYILK